MSNFDTTTGVRLEKVQYTTRGGVLCTYKSDTVFGKAVSGRKSDITELSVESRKRLAFTASNASCGWASMITLTYGAEYPHNGQQVKRDLNLFLSALRYKITGVRYLWFLEFQQRGAPHVHILLSTGFDEIVFGPLVGKWIVLASAYAESDTSEENIRKFNLHQKDGVYDFWQNARSECGLSHYAVKYATKTEQKSVPTSYQSVGRFWGATRGLVEYVGEEYIQGGDYTPRLKEVLERKNLSYAVKFVFGD